MERNKERPRGLIRSEFMIPTIRTYTRHDVPGLRNCVMALQEYERTIDPRLLEPEDMADRYLEHVMARCREANGRIFVAEHDGETVGFVVVLAEEWSAEPDEPPGTYALVSDLAVLEPWRRQGIGRALLEQAESFARNAGATEIRVNVLAGNRSAAKLYEQIGFTPYLMVLSKELSR